MVAQERRKYVRLESQFILTCEPYSIPTASDSKNVASTTKNISAGGILFEAAESYDIGALLKIDHSLL